jgi:hypothetical protein
MLISMNGPSLGHLSFYSARAQMIEWRLAKTTCIFPEGSMVLIVNPAQVLTLWAAVVAERQGYNWQESLSLGKAVATLTTQSKGEHIGNYASTEIAEETARKCKIGKNQFIELCGRNVPARRTKNGIRALSAGVEVDTVSVERYIADSFGEDLKAVTVAMRKLAHAHSKDDLQPAAYGLYEKFMPASASRSSGFNGHGKLDVEKIEACNPAAPSTAVPDK